MDDKIFDDIKKFAERYVTCDKFSEMIEKTMKESKKTIIGLKPMFNVLPFENELNGKKLNGKEVPEVVVSDNCYITYFDNQNRIILIANISEFLSRGKEKPYVHEFCRYFYQEEKIVVVKGTASRGVTYIHYYYIEKGKPVSFYFVNIVSDENYRGYGEYFYKKEQLEHIENNLFWDSRQLSYKEKFVYDPKGKLSAIIDERDGKRKYVYVTKRPKKFDNTIIKEKMIEATQNAFLEVIEKYKSEIISFGLYIDDGATMITPAANTKSFFASCADSSVVEKEFYKSSTTEWELEGTFGTNYFSEISRIISEYSGSLPEDSLVESFQNQILELCVECLVEIKKDDFFAKYCEDLFLSVNVLPDGIGKSKFDKIIKRLNS